jgi:hypothetical protein
MWNLEKKSHHNCRKGTIRLLRKTKGIVMGRRKSEGHGGVDTIRVHYIHV